VDYRFFLGRPAGQPESDEVFLDVDDGYLGLSHKTRAMCAWAHGCDYDFIHKTDTDTLVNPWTFLHSGFEQHDYMGGENADRVPTWGNRTVQFASGGAGYWLSKKAMAIVASTEVMTNAEDVFVAIALLNKGILPVWHRGYRWRPGETVDKDMVSLHFSSALQRKYDPKMMYEYYQKIGATNGS